ncbi:MAG: ATP-binding cassette domain-containing protein [Bacilli bacterium]|nr:ATP-binding cassette domain-containing protein [Bacilli bacterium]MDD4809041.1 ATP-binding cassette domain-containing protein [Bacilli bacterium]
MEIKFDSVYYTYNQRTPLNKKVLNNLNVEFKKDKVNGIIGKSGSGKTTMIELINALLVPTSGKVSINKFINKNGKKIKDVNKLRRQVGLVFQFPEEQFFNKTVKKELLFGIKYLNYQTKNSDKRCSDALKMVGLDDSYLDRNPFTLSSGEKRKVAIASILIFNPKVIILDEPTIGLDSISKNNLIKLIKMLKNKYHKTIIIVSHDVDMLHQICDYIYVINNGEVVMEGTKYEVFSNPDELTKYGIKCPKIMEFSNKVLAKKNIKIGYRDDIMDLIKDVYRHVK